MNAPRSRLPRGLSPLRRRNYSLFWAGWLTTRTGRAVEDLGAVWLMYELTASPALLGVLGLFRAVPALVFTPIAGVVSDRVDQRRLLLITQGLGLIASLALWVLVIAGVVEFWHLYIQVAIQTAIDAFDGSARQALFPRLVPRDELPEAVALSATAPRTATLIGPALGGVAIAQLGVASPFLINAVTFLALIAALLAMRDIEWLTLGERGSFRSDLTAGLRYIVDKPVLSGLLRLEIVFGVLQINSVIVTLVGRELLGVGPEGLGGLLSATALGALIALFAIIAVGQPQRQGRFILINMLVYTAALAAFGLSRDYLVSFLLIAGMGLLDSLSTVTRHSVMQLSAPAEMRGRVMANMGTITRATTQLAETQSGFAVGALGAPVALVAAAGVLGTATVVTTVRNGALRNFRRDELVREAA